MSAIRYNDKNVKTPRMSGRRLAVPTPEAKPTALRAPRGSGTGD